MSAGPLDGIKIIELAGMGPAPFGAMMLADMGAEIIRVERVSDVNGPASEYSRLALLNRGRRSVALDLKVPAGRNVFLRLTESADVLIEGYRPGVMERLGLGPDVCAERNPRLVYARITGWGQDGPLARVAGHDINYIAVAGALRNFAREGQSPTPPLSLVGDFGGGGMLLAFGVVCGLLESSRSGRGQVIDAAMVDGVAAMMTVFYGFLAQGRWPGRPGANFCDTGAPDYEVYETADGEYMAVGALEPEFYSEFVAGLGLSALDLPARDPENWRGLKEQFATVFRTRTRDDWVAVFAGTDACCFPLLSMSEAPTHPHLVARRTYVTRGGQVQPAPAPRFERTPGAVGLPPPRPGEHSQVVLKDWGIDADEIAELHRTGVIEWPSDC